MARSTLRVAWPELWLSLLVVVSGVFATAAATAAALLSLDALDVFPPFLPAYVAERDTIENLELRVYVSKPEQLAASSVIRVTPTCDSMVFSPSSFVFDASFRSVYRFRLEPIASGEFTIQYVAQEEAYVDSDGSGSASFQAVDGSSVVLFTQTIRVLEPPTSFDLSDSEWNGVILKNDSFDQQPHTPDNASKPYSSPFWSQLMHGYPSDACGMVDGDRALYFTSLGDRFAVTAPLDLLGFHGKMHFYHVYGSKSVQSYDAVGDNRVSCELVDAEEETVFSYLPPGQDYLNRSAWQQLYEVSLAHEPSGGFSTHSVSLPLSAMHASARFRWEQKNHSSFPLDIASGLTTDAILQAENDATSVNGQLGLEEQEVWRYRNLFDQWALDNVRLEVRLNVPLFVSESDAVTPGSTSVVVASPIQHSWVEFLVGDGTHAFPSCGSSPAATTSATQSVAQLTTSGYVHAVACLDVNASRISSFPARSPRFLVQARRPQIASSLDVSTAIDKWSVTLACEGCDFMRYTLLPVSGSASLVSNERESPSCSYGTLVNEKSHLVSLSSNVKVQLVACGQGLVASELVDSSALTVRPRAPMFAFEAPSTTVSGRINVTVVPSDPVSVGILYSVSSDEVPRCSDSESAIQSAGSLTIEVNVWDVVRAVACCLDRACDDSAVAEWGPLQVRAIAPVFSSACSRVKPLTMVVDVSPVTVSAEIRYHVGALASPLTCVSGGLNYTEPIEVSMTSTAVHAISCLDGLEASGVAVMQVDLDACCSGLDAYRFPSCAHVLLLDDDFSECVSANRWDLISSQWGGDDVNGGVHASNVACINHEQLKKHVLALGAHGDLYPGTTPVGLHRSVVDGSLRERTMDDDRFLEWALDGASTIPCNQRERCPARRVGAAVSTKLELNAGILTLRIKPCDAFGTLTQVWWGKYEDNEAFAQQQVPFLPLWKAALYQAKTTTNVPFVLSSPMSDSRAEPSSSGDGFMDIAMQWNASEGRANLYVNGALVLKQVNDAEAVSSLADSTLSLGVWFPNAIAGEPLFESCSVLVDKVQVFKMEIAGGRWCDFESEQQQHATDTGNHTVSCESDTDCRRWVTQNCFMDVYEALCVVHYDEVGDFQNAQDVEQDEGEDRAATGNATAAAPLAKTCHFRLQPVAYSSVSSTEMTTRDQSLHLSDEEE